MSAAEQPAAAPAEPLTVERYSRTVAQVATIHLFARASEAPEEVLTASEASQVAEERALERAQALLTSAGRADVVEDLLRGLPGADWSHSTVVVKTPADFEALVEALGAKREADMLLTSFKPPRVRMSATRGRLSVQVDREAGPEDVLTLLKK